MDKDTQERRRATDIRMDALEARQDELRSDVREQLRQMLLRIEFESRFRPIELGFFTFIGVILLAVVGSLLLLVVKHPW